LSCILCIFTWYFCTAVCKCEFHYDIASTNSLLHIHRLQIYCIRTITLEFLCYICWFHFSSVSYFDTTLFSLSVLFADSTLQCKLIDFCVASRNFMPVVLIIRQFLFLMCWCLPGFGKLFVSAGFFSLLIYVF